ncbi:hypothetical protein [Thalassomonas sp. RHCl1]|uniref:hypothetical protein n=1 Tax=Thalassomonas sp. RHCl1 TaxID=2995320 RepID=UPI00248B7BBB|nr:hypothetical protein [Thalassomonas sp. RHCl1]
MNKGPMPEDKFHLSTSERLDAVKEWFKKEITESSNRFCSLFTFFFGVSSASLSVFLLLVKISKIPFNIPLVFAISCYLLSTFFIINELIREPEEASTKLNINEDYRNEYTVKREVIRRWYAAWLLAVIFSFMSLFLDL